MTASAWNTMYLNCEDNNWGQGSSLPFKWIETNSYYYVLSPDHIINGDFYFRFYVSWDDNTGGEHVAPQTDGEVITSEVNSNVSRGSENGSFKLAQNPDAKFVVICIYWANETWNLYSQVITETTTVAFVDVDNNWATAKAYAWMSNGVKLMGEWPGTQMTKESGIYTIEVPYIDGSKILFTDKEEGSNQSSDFDLTQNAIYKYNEKVESVPVSIGSLGFATFSSAYPVDFSNTGVTAYRATQTRDNKVLLSKVSGKVPAATGLVLKADEGNYTIPTAVATESVGYNNMVASVVETPIPWVYLGGDYYYFLAGDSKETLGFYEVESEGVVSAAGKAYYKTSVHALAPDTEGEARVAWIIEDETTGINAVKNAQNADVVYDLQGRQANSAKAGLYIKNGKKFIVK